MTTLKVWDEADYITSDSKWGGGGGGRGELFLSNSIFS